MNRFTRVLLVVVALAVAGEAAAQRKDTVRFTNRTGISGYVRRDTWRGLELDRDGDGSADKTYPAEKVDRVDYANPEYVLRAQLKRSNPKELIRWYVEENRVYDDTNLSRPVRQQVYYDVAEAYMARARRGERGMVAKAEAALARLFREVPDTRYAVRGRKEMGELYLELGRSRDAVRHFEVLAGGKYGPEVTKLSKLLVARVELTLGRWDRAERVLAGLAADPAFAQGASAQEVTLLRCRALVGLKQYPRAWAGVEKVLAGKPDKRILGLAYCVLGDYFAARGKDEPALTAYLKVLLMYAKETDGTERSRSKQQAVVLLKKLGREDVAARLTGKRK